MAQPPFVPHSTPAATSYVSPPRRAGSWTADRPGEVEGAAEAGAATGFGSQGPDQGYVFKLAELLEPEIHLQTGEQKADVIAGCGAVAMKRASLFGRGPVVHDLRAALCLWGFLDEEPDAELVAVRRSMFTEVAHPHHYVERRLIADAVAPEILHRPHQAIAETCSSDWRASLDLPDAQ